MTIIGSRIGRNASVGTVTQVIIMVSGFIITPVILASLGQTSFGVLALVNSFSSYIGVLDLGIGASLIRFMCLYYERGDSERVTAFAGFALMFYFCFAAAGYPIVFVSAKSIAEFLHLPDVYLQHARLLFSIVFTLFITYALIGILSAKLTAMHRLDLAAIAGLSGALVNAALVITLTQRFPTVWFILLCGFAQAVTTGLISYIFGKRLSARTFSSPLRLDRADLKGILSFGLWTQISNVTAVVNLEADKVVITRNIGVQNVTPYQVANRIALLNRTFPLQLLSSFVPAITAQITRGITSSEVALLYSSATRSLMVATLLITGFIAGAAPDLLRLWLGKDLPGAASLCIALVVSYAVNNLTGVGAIIMRARGSPEYETMYGISSAVLNVGLTVALTPHFGLTGVVASTIIGNTVGSTFFIVLFHRRMKISWRTTILGWLTKLLVVTVMSSLTCHAVLGILDNTKAGRIAISGEVALAGILYVTLYAATGAAIGLWKKQEVDWVKQAARDLFVTKRGQPTP